MCFIDLLRLMASSLDRPSENFSKCECKVICNCLRNYKEFKEIIKKGIYPYEQIDSYKKNKWYKFTFNRQVLS